MKNIFVPAFAAAFVSFFAASACADEGMWTFDNFPSAAVNQKYGVTINGAWLDRVRASTVRVSSCSGAIVDGQGLLLTAQHCAYECAQSLSTKTNDYIESGFSAAKREGELQCPDMNAVVLDSIGDVTKRIQKKTANETGEAFIKARDTEIAAIEKEGCAGRGPAYSCQVVTLYHGGQYKLYTYRKYSDVRIVFTPEEKIAAFGGDPDNFNFPRYDLDFCFLRVYDDGKPAATPIHLSWRATPPIEGEPVFVPGNPGRTDRLLTADQLETMRDQTLPNYLYQFAELRGRLVRFGEESAENKRISSFALLGMENYFKQTHGEEQALTQPRLIAEKRKADRALKAKVDANRKLKAEIGDPWADIAKAEIARRALQPSYSFEEQDAAVNSDLFYYARAIVRAAEEREKPESERARSYTNDRLPRLERSVVDGEPVHPALEELVLEFWLSKLRENLTVDSPATKLFLGKESPEALAATLSKSKLADRAYRKKLWDGGLAAVKASDDPMIKFALATDGASHAVTKEYEERVTGPSARAAEKIAKARFAVYADNMYPDATFSLRLSYGKVAGWTYNGETVKPFTHLSGLWRRATGQPPFDLPPRWKSAKNLVDSDVVFDFTTNTDVIGGNSGSPLVDAKGNVIGVVFDTNIYGLGGDFGFDPNVNRTIVVSTAAITEALKKVYKNETLVKELMDGAQ